jgi:hypothetical protein
MHASRAVFPTSIRTDDPLTRTRADTLQRRFGESGFAFPHWQTLHGTYCRFPGAPRSVPRRMQLMRGNAVLTPVPIKTISDAVTLRVASIAALCVDIGTSKEETDMYAAGENAATLLGSIRSTCFQVYNSSTMTGGSQSTATNNHRGHSLRRIGQTAMACERGPTTLSTA